VAVRAEFVNPFVSAAFQVLEAELGESPAKGEVRLEESHYTPNDVTAIIGVVGRVSGTVLYSLSEKTAAALASAMLGQTIPVFDRLAESAVAELGNMISGRASALLEEAGYHCRITPPALVIGKKTIISTFPFQRLVVTLITRFGEMNIAVALREAKMPVPDHPLGGMLSV
jgi:chemotaxis protein CheX